MNEKKPSMDYRFKILTLGDSSVGKTSILQRYGTNKYNPSQLPTIGIDLVKKDIVVDEKNVKLQIWDTAGQERFRSITKNYYRNANGILLVFDMNELSSFNKLGRWYDDIKSEADSKVPVILVGNKKDIAEDFDDKLGIFESEAKNMGIDFFAVSALDGTNIDEVFISMTKKMIEICDYENESSETEAPLTRKRFCC